MRKYIDPVYLAVNEEAWLSRIYLEIFNSLNTMLECIEDVEKSTDTLYQLVKFKMSENLFAEVYGNNPFKNNPEVQEFYTKLFKDKIIPDLYRRFEWCPSLCTILAGNAENCQFTNSLLPEDVLFEWNHLIELCLSCDSNEMVCLMSPKDSQTTLVETDNDLNNKIFITNNVEQLFDISKFLSKNILEKSDIKQKEIFRQAITIYYNQSVIKHGWPVKQAQDYEFDDAFWRSIDRSKLVEEDRLYKDRFVNSMTQVVYDLDIDIRKHKYEGDKITLNRKKYTKYSADVFKMGRGTLDNRCSRIFYCKVNNLIHFYEFEPDRHAGE